MYCPALVAVSGLGGLECDVLLSQRRLFVRRANQEDPSLRCNLIRLPRSSAINEVPSADHGNRSVVSLKTCVSTTLSSILSFRSPVILYKKASQNDIS